MGNIISYITDYYNSFFIPGEIRAYQGHEFMKKRDTHKKFICYMDENNIFHIEGTQYENSHDLRMGSESLSVKLYADEIKMCKKYDRDFISKNIAKMNKILDLNYVTTNIAINDENLSDLLENIVLGLFRGIRWDIRSCEILDNRNKLPNKSEIIIDNLNEIEIVFIICYMLMLKITEKSCNSYLKGSYMFEYPKIPEI